MQSTDSTVLSSFHLLPINRYLLSGVGGFLDFQGGVNVTGEQLVSISIKAAVTEIIKRR